MADRSKAINVAFVGGPMYDHLYAELPKFEAQTGYTVNIVAQLIHPELNELLATEYRNGTADYDLISTHTKYAPSQQQWLLPLDEYISADELAAFNLATVQLARIDGKLMGLPRNIDVRLLYYRKDLFEAPTEQEKFRAQYGRDLDVPKTWEDLKDVAKFFTRRPRLYGYIYPGRFSGLFGTFYELLAMAGGELFDADLHPVFNSQAGEWALTYLTDLYLNLRVTPDTLPEWHYDEVAQVFRFGQCAMVTDWPGGYHLYTDPTAPSRVVGKFGLALYPVGPAGLRRVYAGGFTFAIPTSVKNRDGALALLRFLTSDESQYREATAGVISVRPAVQARIRAEAAPGSLDAHRLDLLDQTVRDCMLIPPKFPQYPAVEDALWTSLQAAIIGEQSVKDALSAAETQVRAILAG